MRTAVFPGRYVQDRFVRKNPDLVLVDSVVIAKAPARFFSAGIGDALATFYEADACRRAGAANLCGGKGPLLAHAAARLCLDTVLKRGRLPLPTVARIAPHRSSRMCWRQPSCCPASVSNPVAWRRRIRSTTGSRILPRHMAHCMARRWRSGCSPNWP